MKNFLQILALGLCGFAGTTFADDFKSMVIPGDGSGVTPNPLPRVHGDQFMVIRNFTQEDGPSTARGVVMISTDGGVTWVQVLSAAFLDTTKSPPDVINSVVIAGPADVRATCGAAIGSNCFISFKKDSN
ncbi:MAG TPA: hypothetical protein VGZ31_02555 [Chthoniobacterales bacterium]|jgi:hypothetical protein|nr:hypothetical protein [Chthoniobacterales bacterium]